VTGGPATGQGPGSEPGPDADVEGLLRTTAPRALGAVVRRFGHFADAEDAVQEALLAAAQSWPTTGVPDNPLAWMVRVASRRLADRYRSDEARRRREVLAASWSRQPADPVSGRDDTLTLFFLCCHPSLSSASAVALTLRAVGGLTTAEIASAFLTPERTMAQRISRAKRTVADAGARFALPDADAYRERLALVLRVVYLVYNESYTSSSGDELDRPDLATEAIRLGHLLRDLRPHEPEVAGLLALMLLTTARRAARTTATGALVPLSEQDRSRWDRDLVARGTVLATAALEHRPLGEYAAQAAIAALHDAAPRYEETDWARISSLYSALERITDSPVVRLNKAVAVAMIHGPDAGLRLVDALAASGPLAESHRVHAVRAHLLEQKGDREGALTEYVAAANASANLRERDYLTVRAATLAYARDAAAVTPPSKGR
jgi:RNA polymerase sigma factor (sigma-70 family)